MTTVLDYKPNSFTVRELLLRMPRGQGLHAEPIGPEMTFPQMQKRRITVPADEMWATLTREDGVHQVANLGVGTSISTTINGQQYLLGVNHNKGPDKALVFNHVGGYFETRDYVRPFHSIAEEIMEEVLPVDSNGRLLGIGMLGGLPQRVFPEHFQPGERLNLEPRSEPVHPHLIQPFIFDGKPLLYSPGVHLEPERNTAKIFWNFDLTYRGGELPMRELGLSFHTSHERYDPAKGMLEVSLQPNQIYFGRMENGRLTGEFFYMSDGELVPAEAGPIFLGEPFAVDRRGITLASRVTMEDYRKAHDESR